MIELCSIPDDVRITVLRFIGARGWHLTDALDLASLVMGERERCAVVAKEATLYSGCPYEPIADEIATPCAAVSVGLTRYRLMALLTSMT